ncbi:MAG: hypothetical protein IT372_19910 [Polyangiaceae bacterium]|nr:hypothetical protein [Polyangiaceae bacterium]
MRLARLGFVPVLGLAPLLSFGCSDPVPATPRGAWVVSFESPSFESCPITSHNATMGEVSDSQRKTVLVDGEGGATVQCSVSGSGSFSVTAFAASTETQVGFSMAIKGISSSATLDAPATGSISFSSPTTSGEAVSSLTENPCIFYFVPNTQEGVAEGKIWVAFQCPAMRIDTADGCRIKQGYAVFENCDT